MPSVGERLRLARERRGLQVAEVARETRINTEYLSALEAGDYARLPSGFYVKAFLRQYANFLDVPYAEIEGEAEALLAAATPPSALSLEPRREETGLPPLPDVLEPGRRPRRRILESVALLLAVVGGCAVVYSLWMARQSAVDISRAVPPPAATGPAKEAAPQPAAPPPETAPPPAAAEEQPSPAGDAGMPQPDAGGPPPDSGGAPAGPLWIRIVAREDAWVRVGSGGSSLFTGILHAGESRTFSGLQDAVLRVGNAGGLDVVFNGQPMGPIGPRGHVRTVNVTPERFEIVAPEPVRTAPAAAEPPNDAEARSAPRRPGAAFTA